MRLDKYVSEKFDLPSRTAAANLIKTGAVAVNGRVEKKTSFDVSEGASVAITDDNNYASQGAYKLAEAHKAFGFDVRGAKCADIGCSNGGFTDLLLRLGASEVACVDVGECALPDCLLSSGKVEFFRANARELPFSNDTFDFICVDLSFISLTLVLGEIYRVLKRAGFAVALVKPQFEAGKQALNKQGIVTDEKPRLRALEKVKSFAAETGFELIGETEAPIRFRNKNVEYLLFFKKDGR